MGVVARRPRTMRVRAMRVQATRALAMRVQAMRLRARSRGASVGVDGAADADCAQPSSAGRNSTASREQTPSRPATKMMMISSPNLQRVPDVPRFFLTTAIDYANGDPHIGHALEKIGADVIARYRRLRGDDVHLLIGMDEHGQKVQQTAAAQGVPPQAFADDIAARFQAMWARLGIQ